MKTERTLKNLRRSTRRSIFIYLRDAQIGERFLRDAEAEGFTIAGDKPTAKPYASVMALHYGTINYVGANGMMRFGCGDTTLLRRVDYEKYVSGAADYGCLKTEQKGRTL